MGQGQTPPEDGSSRATRPQTQSPSFLEAVRREREVAQRWVATGRAQQPELGLKLEQRRQETKHMRIPQKRSKLTSTLHLLATQAFAIKLRRARSHRSSNPIA